MTAYEMYIITAKAFREACGKESVPMHRLSAMSVHTRELWCEKQCAGRAWLEEQNWFETNKAP